MNINLLRRRAVCSVSCIVSIFCAGTNLSAETNAVEATPSQLKKLSLEDLMKLDVTSVSKRAEPYSQAAASIQVITQDQIRRSGASSIPEALRLANNLQVAQTDSRNWAISARGFNTTTADKLLVLIDGRSVYTPLFSGVFWDVQDYLLEDLDRIEVISGPGATLWGANAVNGVINIISKGAKDTQGLLLTGGGGTELRDFGGLRYGGTLASNVYYRVYGKYFDRDSSVFSTGKEGDDDWRMGQGGFRVDWDASSRDLFTLQGDLYNGDASQRIGDNLTLTGGNILSRWTRTLTEDSSLNAQFYYDRTHRKIPGIYGEDLDTYDFDFQHRFPVGERNSLMWGVGYRFTHNRVENTPSIGFFPARLDRSVFSAFVQDEITLLENLLLAVGTKFEHNDYTGVELQPSVRLSWNITSNQTVWSAVSRAVRTPSRIDRDLYVPGAIPRPGTNSLFAGSPDFTSEKLIAYELGYRVQVNEKISGSISTFFNQYDDVRSIRPGSPQRIANDLQGDTYGVELDANYQIFPWWRLRGGYSFIEENIHEKSGKTDAGMAISESSGLEQQFSVRSTMDLPGRVELEAGVRWVDQLTFISAGRIGNVPSYFGLDVRLGWHATENLEFSVVGQNLLYDHRAQFGFPSDTQHEIERSVYGKVTWTF